MGSIIDAVLFWLGAFVAGCLLALFLLTALGAGLVKAAGLPRPDGGSETRRASTTTSPETGMSATRLTQVASSSNSVLGSQWEGWLRDGQRQAPPSSTAEPTPCGCNEAGNPGPSQARSAALDRGWGEDLDGNVIVWQD